MQRVINCTVFKAIYIIVCNNYTINIMYVTNNVIMITLNWLDNQCLPIFLLRTFTWNGQLIWNVLQYKVGILYATHTCDCGICLRGYEPCINSLWYILSIWQLGLIMCNNWQWIVWLQSSITVQFTCSYCKRSQKG